jgi:hypothetical protein
MKGDTMKETRTVTAIDGRKAEVCAECFEEWVSSVFVPTDDTEEADATMQPMKPENFDSLMLFAEGRNMKAAVAILETAGVSASYEYPGFIQVVMADGLLLNCGTVNGPFTCQLADDDAQPIDSDLPEDGIPATSAPEEIAAHVQACIAIVEKPTTPHAANLWESEFGSDYAAPAELTSNPAFKDASWGNDIAPKFEVVSNPRVLLWVDHPTHAEREVPGSDRFWVAVYDDSGAWMCTTYQGDDLEAAMASALAEAAKM